MISRTLNYKQHSGQSIFRFIILYSITVFSFKNLYYVLLLNKIPIILIIYRMYYSLVKCSMNQYETAIMDVHITYLYSLGKI